MNCRVRDQDAVKSKPISGYHNFVKELCSSKELYSSTEKGKTLSAINEMASKIWKTMTDEQKEKYNPPSSGNETKVKTAYAYFAQDFRKNKNYHSSMTKLEKDEITSNLKKTWKENVNNIQNPYHIKESQAKLLKYIYTDENGVEGKLNNYSFEVVN